MTTGDTITTLKGTTEISSWLEKGTSKALGALEDVALPAGAGATFIDLAAHQACMASQFPNAASPTTVAF